MKIGSKILLLAFMLSVLPGLGSVFADVAIKIVVVNPSESDKRNIPVEFNLPKELKREDILDTGVLKVGYDVGKDVFRVEGEVLLEPRESRVLKIMVNDVWFVSEETVEEIRVLLKKNIANASKEKRDAVDLAGRKIEEKLDRLLKEQQVAESDIDKRMKNYRAGMESVRQIREEIFTLERVAETAQDKDDSEEIVKLLIKGTNPTDKELDIPFKYYLPESVRPEYIVEFAGFKYKYDTNKRKSFLEKQEVFAPLESKKWVIEVRDVWKIDLAEVDYILQEADDTKEIFSNSPIFELCNSIDEEIEKEAEKIKESQEAAQTVSEKITIFKVNSERFELMKDYLIRMQSLALQDSDKKHNVLRDIMIEDETKQVSDVLMKRIFKPGKISLFKMILGVIVFVVIVTILSCLTWLVNVKSRESKGILPVQGEDGKKEEAKEE